MTNVALQNNLEETPKTLEDTLSRNFLINFPRLSAKKLESLPVQEAGGILSAYPVHIILPVWGFLTPGSTDALFLYFEDQKAKDLLEALEPRLSAELLSRMNDDRKEKYFALMHSGIVKELKDILAFPDNCVGRIMNTHINAFHKNITVEELLSRLKDRGIEALHHLFLLDDDNRLIGQVDVHQLVLADSNTPLEALVIPVSSSLMPLDPKEDAIAIIETKGETIIPIVDGEHKLAGVIYEEDMIQTLREDLATGMQTMVGVSKEEKALSSSFFAVKKRLPWLMINLLTAFLAAAVVGAFEGTIAKYTALAILLPVAAGQSGNTGAQALAVTMRGLTLREITIRHWLRVMLKECGAGFMNGVAIAVVCSAGVYVWSQSVGLGIIIALSMVSSMTMAGISGALVPIVLRRLGQDPAQSSSIILTTITDIAGFMSFLGIATLLSGMLDSGMQFTRSI